jgi:hypothetical protein
MTNNMALKLSPSPAWQPGLFLAAALCCLTTMSTSQAAHSPEEIVADFDQRVEQMFRAESGKPLVRAEIGKPLGAGRGNFARH